VNAMTSAYKDVVMIGGPNGAGKTTTATTMLPKELRIQEFVNADEIAYGLSPFNPEGSTRAAGRLMIKRIHELIGRGESFAFETTCSGRAHAQTLSKCRDAGYRLTLIFLWLPSAKEALRRVARRVAQGGHRVPKGVVIRRYAAGLKNLQRLYLPIVDIAYIYDNTDEGGILIAERQPGQALVVCDDRRWKQILEANGD
jgi:predicted ABC-type ATPase